MNSSLLVNFGLNIVMTSFQNGMLYVQLKSTEEQQLKHKKYV